MLNSFDWTPIDAGFVSDVKVGDLVQHRNGGQWGKGLRVIPQHDGSVELKIEGICRPDVKWDDPSVRWWATYHIRAWQPSYGPIQENAP